jgi:hypothetical protein
MRWSIWDIALSMDPYIKIEPEVEDVRQLLSFMLAPYALTPSPPYSFFWILPIDTYLRATVERRLWFGGFWSGGQ